MSRNHRPKMSVGWAAALAIVATAPLLACSTTREARSVERTGFFSDREWALLKENDDPPPALLYINPSIDVEQYHGVMLDSVSFWRLSDSERPPPDEAEMILEYFYAALHREIGKVGTVVDRPGPGIGRLRIGITEAEGANVAGRVVTTVVPQLRLLTTAGGMATDASVTVGEAGVAAKLTDSMTDQLLAAAADRQIGQKSFSGMTDKWGDMKSAIDLWARAFATDFGELRGVVQAD